MPTILRSCLFNLYFFFLTVVLGLGAFWVRLAVPHRALPYAARWCGLTLAGLRRICAIEIEVSGMEHLPDTPVLIVSQHQSVFDTLVWLTLVPRPAYVMKLELTRLPLVGPMLLLAGMIPVDRDGGARALRHLLRAADAAIADGRQIVIFPEGTRVAAGEVRSLQPGVAALAAHTKLPLFPVATDSGRLWPSKGFIKRRGTIHIAIGPAISSGTPSGSGRAALLQAITAAWTSLQAKLPAQHPDRVR